MEGISFEDRLRGLLPDKLDKHEGQESYFIHCLYWEQRYGLEKPLTAESLEINKASFIERISDLALSNPNIIQIMKDFKPQPLKKDSSFRRLVTGDSLEVKLKIDAKLDEKAARALIAYTARRLNIQPPRFEEYFGGDESYKMIISEYREHFVTMEAGEIACHMYDKLLEETKKISSSSDDKRNLSIAAFKRPYVDQKGAIDHYVKFVRSTINEFTKNPEMYYGLFATIVQSSGYGKSRLVNEAGKEHLNTIYVNVTTVNCGYPQADTHLRSFLLVTRDHDQLKYFLIVCYVVAYQRITTYKGAGADTQIRPLSLLQQSDYTFETYWDEVMAVIETNNTEMRRKYTNFFSQQQTDFQDHFNDDSVIVNGCIRVENLFILPEFVLVFDEAKVLFEEGDNSIFNRLLRAQEAIGSTNMLLLFTDTLGTLSNIVPHVDASQRSYRYEKRFLLKPFYEILTFDVLAEDGLVPPDEDDWEYLRQIFYQGRPLWRALYENRQYTVETVRSMVHYAMQKLAFSREGRLPSLVQGAADTLCRQGFSDVSKVAAIISVLAVRFGIQGVTDHKLASTLMSTHMGTGMYIDANYPSRIVVQYPSEPVLAEAACRCLHPNVQLDYQMVSYYIQVFIAKCAKDYINVGDIGELLVRIILSLTFDYVRMKTPPEHFDVMFSLPITVSQFIDELVDGGYADEYSQVFGCRPVDCIPDILKNGQVCITSWAALSPSKSALAYIDEPWLEALYNKRSGIILSANQPEVSLLIPVKIKKSSYSFIIVKIDRQVETEERFNNAGPYLELADCIESDCPNPHLTLYIEIGSGIPLKDLDKTDASEHSKDYPSHLMLLGFESFKLCSNEALRSLFMRSWRRQTDYIDEEVRSSVLYTMNPVAFKYVETHCPCQRRGSGDCCSKPTCPCHQSGRACNEHCNCML